MVALQSFALAIYLLATSKNNLPRKNNRSQSQDTVATERPTSGVSRSRYDRSGKKSTNDGRDRRSKGNSRNNNDGSNSEGGKREVLEVAPPPLTVPNGPRPTFYTCRHTYEGTLMDEIQRAARMQSSSSEDDDDEVAVTTSSLAPGLVIVEGTQKNTLPELYDPVYALQVLPDAVVVSADSIKGLAKVIYQGLLGSGTNSNTDDESSEEEEDARCCQLRHELRAAPKGSLAVHGLVPGMCKGQNTPVMLNRSQKIADELAGMLRKGFPAARKVTNNNNLAKSSTADEQPVPSSLEETNDDEERWILQVMVMTPDVAVASLTKCTHIGPGRSYWPNWHHPVGMAKVDIIEVMPSSAYRKLMEALECMRIRPQPLVSRAVDLGACPGGWTSVLRRLDCPVIAVDRTKLDPVLMKDDLVEFVKGDAFTFVPDNNFDYRSDDELVRVQSPPNSWMVSDIIAYPERVAELLDRWCGGHWATYMIVTMKFQGDNPTLSDLDHAMDIAKRHGYECRAKHFFNNKNEVTLMIHEKSDDRPLHLESGILGSPMYKALLPRNE